MLKINEIFYSIQGESTKAGLPTVFVRTSGCHLRCTYCDTTYAYHDGQQVSLENVIQKIKSFLCPHVCLTGGEPLLQKEVYPLMKTLCDQGYQLSLETSGDIYCGDVDPRVLKIIDVKTPDSGEPKAFNEKNITLANVNTEFKFVICSEKDFYWSLDFCKKHQLIEKTTVLFSPSFQKIDEEWLAKKILKENVNVRLQLQLHKYIWNPNTRGV